MPRLDADRIDAWSRSLATIRRIERELDRELRNEWAISLGWFEVLAALRSLDGRARPQTIADTMGIPHSSLSRRLDRLAEEGWIERHSNVDPDDGRAIDVQLTTSGRKLWREMNITYRRIVQREFARHLDNTQIALLRSITEQLDPE